MGNEGVALNPRHAVNANCHELAGSDLYLDSLVDQIAAVCEAEICLITLIDEQHQWVIAGNRLPFSDIPLALSVCSSTIEYQGVWETDDLGKVENYAENPLVTGPSRVRFYASQRLDNADGKVIGTLCIMDKKRHRLTVAQKDYFTSMAGAIELYLQSRETLKQDLIGNQVQQLLLSNFDDVIYAKDANLNIIYANQAYLQLHQDNNLDEIIGTTGLEGLPTAEAQAITDKDRIALEDGQSDQVEKVQMPDGQIRTFWTRKTLYIGSDGSPCLLAVSRDITRAEENIERLKQSYRELDSFAYIASHDLKAPLNGVEKICGWIEEDLEEAITPDIEAHFTLLKGRIGRMRQLLDDLLEYSRVGRMDTEQHKIKLDEKTAEIVELLDISGFKVTADKAELNINKIPFEMTLRNLLQNAVKHHHREEGTIQVSVRDEKRFYVISVDDDGPGIETEHRDKATQIFQTLKPRDEVEGSGLGLAIVTKSIESLGGTLSILDSPLGGARIQLKWPKYTNWEAHHGTRKFN